MYQIDKDATLFINPAHIVALEITLSGSLIIELSSRNKPLIVREGRLNKTARVMVAEILREVEAHTSATIDISRSADSLVEYLKQLVNVAYEMRGA